MSPVCEGFAEEQVLAVKTVFEYNDITQILIVKDSDNKIVYHERWCTGSRSAESAVCVRCRNWFNVQIENEIKIENPDIKDPLEDTEEYKFSADDDAEETEEKYSEIFDTGQPTVEATSSINLLGVSKPRGTKRKVKKEQTDSKPIRENKFTEFKCDICFKTFTTKSGQINHIKSHEVNKGGTCQHCGKVVKNLKKHVKIVHEGLSKIHCCDFCGKVYKDRTTYLYHMTGHTGERNYPCKVCGKKYRNSSERRRCEKGHEGSYKYVCELCEYRTHYKYKFERHNRVHTKETPYSCSLCQAQFSRKDNFKYHVSKKHADRGMEALLGLFPDLFDKEEDKGNIRLMPDKTDISTESDGDKATASSMADADKAVGSSSTDASNDSVLRFNTEADTRTGTDTGKASSILRAKSEKPNVSSRTDAEKPEENLDDEKVWNGYWDYQYPAVSITYCV